MRPLNLVVRTQGRGGIESEGPCQREEREGELVRV